MVITTVVLSMALAGCSSAGDDALAEARKACADMGFKHGKAPDSASADGSTLTADDWAKKADAYNGIANRLAHAAGQDRRWDRLSNAVTDYQAASVQAAIAADEGKSFQERTAAAQEVASYDVPSIIRTTAQECRKAQA
ncbi:hypothetical protein [Streptomyces mirabilis]|uniref:hypothetical protein n=1 Tax=Streptomyces mirabilis TaxID=68239 RepID=UPI0033B085E3